jgi:hypothetical protein
MRFRLTLIVLTALLLDTSSRAQSITFRLLSGPGAKPIPHKIVSINFYSRMPQGHDPAAHTSALTLKTDAKGEVHFSLPDPAPVYVVASANLRPSEWGCACSAMSTTADVLRRGSGNWTGPPGSHPNPGEIVIWAIPLTFWERVFYPIWE